jgi:hypothetical protein
MISSTEDVHDLTHQSSRAFADPEGHGKAGDVSVHSPGNSVTLDLFRADDFCRQDARALSARERRNRKLISVGERTRTQAQVEARIAVPAFGQW